MSRLGSGRLDSLSGRLEETSRPERTRLSRPKPSAARFAEWIDCPTQTSLLRATRPVLVVAQGGQRINSGGTPCGDVAGEKRGTYEDDDGQQQGSRIIRLGFEEKRFDKPERA
jgi:hypothetical protein